MTFTGDVKYLLSKYGPGYPTQLLEKSLQQQYHLKLSSDLFKHYEAFTDSIKPALIHYHDFLALNKLANNITDLHNLQYSPEVLSNIQTKGTISILLKGIKEEVSYFEQAHPEQKAQSQSAGRELIEHSANLGELLYAIVEHREPCFSFEPQEPQEPNNCRDIKKAESGEKIDHL